MLHLTRNVETLRVKGGLSFPLWSSLAPLEVCKIRWGKKGRNRGSRVSQVSHTLQNVLDLGPQVTRYHLLSKIQEFSSYHEKIFELFLIKLEILQSGASYVEKLLIFSKHKTFHDGINFLTIKKA